MRTILVVLALAALPASAHTQTRPAPAAAAADLIAVVRDGGAYARDVITRSAEAMTEADYAFRPAPDVRSFGELLAHVADSNYGFCAMARGETAPVRDIEKTKKTRADIARARTESFAYCDALLAGLDETAIGRQVQFRGKPRTVGVVLTFFNYHSMLHYGNVITYMRLRGKVPPSSEPVPRK